MVWPPGDIHRGNIAKFTPRDLWTTSYSLLGLVVKLGHACGLVMEATTVSFQGRLCLPTAQEFGLFKPDEDPTKGRWLETGRTLEYYHLKSGVRKEGAMATCTPTCSSV